MSFPILVKPYKLQTMDTEQFLDKFGTRTGRWLANRLNLSGKGSVQLAEMLSCYAWNLRAAHTLRGVQQMKGQPTERNCYQNFCDEYREQIAAHPQFPNVSRWLRFW